MKNKHLLGWFFMCLLAIPMQAQNQEKLNLFFETRLDYQREYLDGQSVKENNGFKGKYFNIMMNGSITDKLSFSYRQRLNKPNKDASFFDATDWLYLSYAATDKWTLSAGKQVVGIGGFEYDRAPIDVYLGSEYWHNIPCYSWGVSATYQLPKGKDKITFQACNSPFDLPHEEMYAFNLMWMGDHGWFSSLYSANLLEWKPGSYICYLSLGNQFKIGNARLQLDYMNRATDEHAFLFRNCSLVGELAYMIAHRVNVFGKVSYDVNRTNTVADLCVLPGTEITRVGGGVEFYPLNDNRNLRLHASGGYTFGKNANPNGALNDGQAFFDLGLKWKIDLLSAVKKVLQ